MRLPLKLKIKILVIVLIIIIAGLTSCNNNDYRSSYGVVKTPQEYKIDNYEIITYVIDSCEYIGYISSGCPASVLTHKGNCKYCLLRCNKN
jgi:hypothetical protein